MGKRDGDKVKKGFVAEAELAVNKSDTTFCLGVNKAKVGEVPELPAQCTPSRIEVFRRKLRAARWANRNDQFRALYGDFIPKWLDCVSDTLEADLAPDGVNFDVQVRF